METTELVSVIIPVYNASRFLSQTIESVLAQTYQNMEIIIIDDCSIDNSVQIARRYEEKDARVKVLVGEKNEGVAQTRNRGIIEAKGEYIALLDSDDLWISTKLERQVKLLRESGAGVAYCSYDFINADGKSILKPFIVPNSTNYKKMLTSSVISCSTALIRTSILKKHHFNPNYYHEDYVLWMELLAIPVVAVGDTEVLMHYRQVAGSRSNKKINSAKERWKIYRDFLGLGLARSVVAFICYVINGGMKYYF